MAGQPSLSEFAARGYVSVEHDAFTTTSHSWQLAGQDIRFVLAQPVRTGASPVVIYMPGLGESSESGERWRAAWASAGYAVVSVQLLDDDATAWTSDLAHEGNFKALGRQRFAEGVMSRRIQGLAKLIDEGRHRSTAGDPAWQGLDWSRVAVAGFDLGAYTTMIVAGEHLHGAEEAAGRIQIRAAIAISPYATSAAGQSDTRYHDVHGPVMSVTGDSDGDALGLVQGAHLREEPFAHMEGPDKFLVSLRGLSHSGLSGNPPAKRRADTAEDSAGKATGKTSRRAAKRGESKDDETPDPGRFHSEEDAPILSADETQMRVIAAQDISTAFLDAYMKGDARARQWLFDDAKRWLAATGDLRRK